MDRNRHAIDKLIKVSTASYPPNGTSLLPPPVMDPMGSAFLCDVVRA